MATTRALAVWMNGMHVGDWIQTRVGADSFQYDERWISSDGARVLSLSLPFTPGNVPHKGKPVGHYFDNLLPDSDAIRQRIRSRFSTGSSRTIDLLSAIGRDCAGAVQLLPAGVEPVGYDRIDGEPLDASGVERAIATALSGERLMGHRQDMEWRISIAGTQEKTALLFHGGRWYRPLAATPTTHILKLPLGLVGNMQADMKDSVENEWLCLRLLRAYGLAVPDCDMARFGPHRVLIVRRFDRKLQSSGWIARLPQEDLCQALALPSSLKYEADGGPGMRDVLRVLEGSVDSDNDKAAFLKGQVLFWLLAATDGHAKNFSLFHERGGAYRMTPFYDVISAWPIIGRGPTLLDPRKARLAMAVRSKNAHWRLAQIQPRHWDAVARLAGLSDARSLLEGLVGMTPRIIDDLARQLPRDFPSRVSGRIFEGLQRGVDRIARG